MFDCDQLENKGRPECMSSTKKIIIWRQLHYIRYDNHRQNESDIDKNYKHSQLLLLLLLKLFMFLFQLQMAQLPQLRQLLRARIVSVRILELVQLVAEGSHLKGIRFRALCTCKKVRAIDQAKTKLLHRW